MMKGKNKKNSKKNAASEIPSEPSVSNEAMRGVVAILIIAFAAFLSLAGLGGGGKFGALVFSVLSWLFGVGYILVPLLLFISSILMFRSFERKFGGVQMFAMALFLISNLGLINVAFPGESGVLGSAVSRPLLSVVDTTATVFFLIAFVIASLIVAFDIHLGLFVKNFFVWLKKPADESLLEEETAPVRGMPDTDSDEEPVPPPTKEVAVPEPQERPARREEKVEAEADGFPILASFDEAYTPPPNSLLAKNKGKPEVGDVKANMNIIKRTLQNFGIQVEMDEASIGPTVTRYSMKPAEGVRLAKIIALQSNLELNLAASPVRIEAPIPGKSLVGIEVPNIARTTLGLGPLFAEESFAESTKPLLLSLGRSISGQGIIADLTKMPHMLVAGTTGSGKSVTIHDFVISLLYRCGPDRLRFIMVDPKRVELTLYNSIPHLLTPVITDAKKCILALKWLAKEMERRYNVLETVKVRDIASYHQNIVAPARDKAASGATDKETPMPEAMPYIVLIIDELADIMTSYPRELEGGIVRLAQMSRAVGIHLILSTQRPSVKVITGLIKANIPARVALQVASQIDSRTILDMGGAEKLLGAGDMLFLSGDMAKPQRLQAAYISEDEVKRVVQFIAKHSEGRLPSEIDFSEAAQRTNDPIFSSMGDNDSEEDDELYSEAKRVILEAGKASTSYLQRKLGVGYARAARLMDLLEEKGVIGPSDGAKPRDIIGAGNADELAAEPKGETQNV
jgi:DNA segregation ATPase FtsK/SpoIIIE, S-DNA-T family